MEKLSTKHGVPTTLKALRFLGLRLRSRPQTVGLVDGVQAARTDLAAKDEAWCLAQEERVAQTAEMTYLDTCLEEDVMQAVLEVRALCGGKTEDERYKKAVAQPPNEALKGVGGDVQERFVLNMVGRFTEEPELAPLKPHASRLKQRLVDFNNASQKRDALYLPELKAQTERRIALEKAQRVYNFMHPQLMMTLQDERLVESFFMPLRPAAKADGETEAADTEG